MSESDQYNSVILVIFGASGDLATKKTFPSLYNLFHFGYLSSKNTRIVGYARSKYGSQDEFRSKATSGIKSKDVHDNTLSEFQACLSYCSGQYDSNADFQKLNAKLNDMKNSVSKQDASLKHLMLFYLALPPSVFLPVAQELHGVLMQQSTMSDAGRGTATGRDCIYRLIVEKPFGHDLVSSNALAASLSRLFDEEQIYRIDHYLGKEMVKNILILRFANVFFNTLWDAKSISYVQITFKEKLGTEGRGGYFDQYGIIRDVMQNHLLQILAVVAMEQPISLAPEHVRDEKVKVLQAIPSPSLSDIVLGQFGSSPDGPGYTDDPGVPKDSLTATFAAVPLYIQNERWQGVPWLLKCGKALDEQKTEIRIQFRDSSAVNVLFPSSELARNELVIRVQPNESVYLKFMVKEPGLGYHPTISELDLSYRSRYKETRIPDAYESLLLECLRGDHSNFVRSDELREAWTIFTPLLDEIKSDSGKKPLVYPFGSRGPQEADALAAKLGFARSEKEYIWPHPKL